MSACTQVAPAHPSTLTDYEAATVRRALKIIERKRLQNAPLMYYKEDYEKYFMLRFVGLTNEQHHVLYVDISRRLLHAEISALGNHKQVTYDLRQITHKAITLGADAVVFAHNHPNDNPTPSEQDVHNLCYCEKVLGPMQIELLESYVVTSHGITSIKNYREKQEEIKHQKRLEEDKKKREQRRAKRAANKAAKVAAQAKLAGEAAHRKRQAVLHREPLQSTQ